MKLQLPGLVRAAPVALVLLLAIGLAWTQEGSIAAADWLPTSAFLALIAGALLAFGGAQAPPRAVLLSTAGLGLLAAWDVVSAAWSPVPALARDEGLLAATYALAVVLPALTLRAAADRLLAWAALVAGLGLLAVASASRLWASGGPSDLHDGRLSFPVGYPNANGAVYLVAFWPAVALAARRSSPVVARAAALAAACAALSLWVATQSKGAGIALAVSLVVVLAVARARLRLAAVLALAAGAVAPWVGPLTAPYRADEGRALEAAVQGAGRSVLAAALLGFAAGLAYALADRRIELGPALRRRLGRVALAAVLAAAGAGVVWFVVAVEHPGRSLDERWESFKTPPSGRSGESHFSRLGSNRYDFWRVTLRDFEREPVAGIGARGFQTSYLRERKSPETPARAHSLELDVLSETGLIGLVLLALGLGPLLLAAARSARTSLLSAGALGAGAEWLVHASGDWIWTFPAVGLPVFLLLGTAAARPERRTIARRVALPAAGALALAAAALFLPPWLSDRLVDRAAESRDPGALGTAKRLDPLSTRPYVVESSLAPAPRAAVAPLERAVRNEPRSAALHYVLGLAYERAGLGADARRAFARAHELSPRDPAIASALRRASDGGG